MPNARHWVAAEVALEALGVDYYEHLRLRKKRMPTPVHLKKAREIFEGLGVDFYAKLRGTTPKHPLKGRNYKRVQVGRWTKHNFKRLKDVPPDHFGSVVTKFNAKYKKSMETMAIISPEAWKFFKKKELQIWKLACKIEGSEDGAKAKAARLRPGKAEES